MNPQVKALVILILLAASHILSAQSSVCNYYKSYHFKKGTTVHIQNKYGDISLLSGNIDSVSVCVKITIDQIHKDLAASSIKMIKVNAESSDENISFATVYDKNFFSAEYLKGRTGFHVDYIVTIPESCDLNISNSFGNIYAGELSGAIKMSLSQGNLTIKKLSRGNIKPLNSIILDHSDANIDLVNWLYLKTRNCQSVSLGRGQALLLFTDFSKIHIGEVNSLVTDSKYDSYNIESIKNLVYESLYSTFEIEKLKEQLKVKASYGSLDIKNTGADFRIADISCSHTPIRMTMDMDISFQTEIETTGTLTDLFFEDYPDIKVTSDHNTTRFRGVAGKDPDTMRMITIKATAGKVTILENAK